MVTLQSAGTTQTGQGHHCQHHPEVTRVRCGGEPCPPSPDILQILPPAGSTQNSDPRPLLWVVLLLAAAALVLGISVSVGLRQARTQMLREMTEGEQAQ